MAQHAMDGPQWESFGWTGRRVNEFGAPEQHLLHPDNPKPLKTVFIHAEGPEGMGIESPSGQDFGAVIEGTFDPQPTKDDRKWGIGPRPGGSETYARNWRLRHVEEYGGLQNIANKISDSIDFMNATGTDQVNLENDEIPAEMDSHDLVKNLYDKRPNFPRNFKTAGRAKHVAEILIKRRDAGIPLTPRPRRGK